MLHCKEVFPRSGPPGYSGGAEEADGMSERPDLQALARQYMDLWQTQLEGLAGDREVAETMARTLELMSAGPAALAAMAAQGASSTATPPPC